MIKRITIFFTLLLIVFLSIFFLKGLSGLEQFLPIIPPVIAIGLAFVTYSVEISLFFGIMIGAVISLKVSMLERFCVAPFKVFDTYVVNAIADKDHVSIIIFTFFIGGVVALITRSGGMLGVVRHIAKFAKNAARAQFMSWLMGVAIFFDDYANTFIVGNAVRPITDSYKISREKLSFIVDSTAAPVTSLVIVSTWIGYEIGLIQDVFKSNGMTFDPYMSFINSIPYRFYIIAMLLFIPITIFFGRDNFSMYEAEKRARTTGDLGAIEHEGGDDDNLKNVKESSSLNAIVPIVVLIIGVVVGLYLTGYLSLKDQSSIFNLKDILGGADSFKSLIWASFIASVVSAVMILFQKIATFEEVLKVWMNGAKSMLPAVIILCLAWGLGSVLKDIGTAKTVADLIGNSLSGQFLPVVIFIVSAFIAFATGTSWGSMAIIFPIAVPLATQLDVSGELLSPVIGAILSGTVFGDHCSPISDTTIMSSMASGVKHIDHVRTQMPYALLVGFIACLFGYLPAGFGVNPYLSLILMMLSLILIVRFTFKKV